MWSHLDNLYRKSQTKSGLYIGKKLTRDHIHLTSYSRMRVDLAAEVRYGYIYICIIPIISNSWTIVN